MRERNQNKTKNEKMRENLLYIHNLQTQIKRSKEKKTSRKTTLIQLPYMCMSNVEVLYQFRF